MPERHPLKAINLVFPMISVWCGGSHRIILG
jgi:hypothetical protein